MKLKKMWRIVFFIGLMIDVHAHVEPKKMLFYTRKKVELAGKAQGEAAALGATIAYEQRNSGEPSKVVNICGLPAFKQMVLLASFNKPVVVKVYAVASVESGKVKPHFQDVADQLDQKVSCIAINLVEQGVQNRAIVAHILAQCGINRVDLPLFLFFRNGRLQLPVRQGFHTKDNLIALIQKEFFSENKNNQGVLQKASHNALHDWIPTHSCGE